MVSPPKAALFCATFLRPEMLHIHRHISGLNSFSPIVLAQKREGDWAVEQIEVVPRSQFRFISRTIEQIRGHPWQITSREAEQMRRIIHENHALVLHVFFGNVAVHLLPLLKRVKVPIVISFHGADVAGAIAGRGYENARHEMFTRATLVLCRSEQLAAKVALLGCPVEKLRIMRAVLPSVEFAQRITPEGGAWRIIQASRLVPKKGLVTALGAFAIFQKKYPQATFTIAGEGPMEVELKSMAENLGIAKQVYFTGFLPQEALKQLFSQSHIFIHPSETINGDVEGVPNAMLEAMACGLPVVATHHGGIPEVITHETTGLLCEEKNHSALADTLERLASDQELYSRLAQSGSDFVRNEFSAEKQIANIEYLYREAAGKSH